MALRLVIALLIALSITLLSEASVESAMITCENGTMCFWPDATLDTSQIHDLRTKE